MNFTHYEKELLIPCLETQRFEMVQQLPWNIMTESASVKS